MYRIHPILPLHIFLDFDIVRLNYLIASQHLDDLFLKPERRFEVFIFCLSISAIYNYKHIHLYYPHSHVQVRDDASLNENLNKSTRSIVESS